jgi:hypothetical protein
MVFNLGMTPIDACKVIEAAGGDTAFAKLLGLDDDGAVQRVNNWKRRGMPSDVILKHYSLIKKLAAQSGASSQAATG